MVLGAHVKPTEKKTGRDCPSGNKSQSINYLIRKEKRLTHREACRTASLYIDTPTNGRHLIKLSDKDPQAVQRTFIAKKLPSTSQAPRMASAEWVF